MSTHRLTRWQKAGALIPMALLVGAWGAAMNNSVLANAADSKSPGVPDVPETAFEQPATVESETPAGIDPQSGSKGTISELKTNGIPDAAMAGYKRAESLIDEAVPKCNLSWTVLAGIGRVESNHGRTDGNSLNDEGTAKPGIYGVPLDGSGDNAKIADTDDGKLDDDSEYDRAVGPMQFLPETWDMVAVDANNDGDKDPQNITDAATAAGIYLCSGGADLGSEKGAKKAVHQYNHSDSYVDLVLSISDKYADGDFTKTPNDQSEAKPVTESSQDESVSASERKQAEQNKVQAQNRAKKQAAKKQKQQKQRKQQAQQPSPQGKKSSGGKSGSPKGSSSSKDDSSDSDSGDSGKESQDSEPKTAGGKLQKKADDTGSKAASGAAKVVSEPLKYTEAAVRCAPEGFAWEDAFKDCVHDLTH